MKKQSASPDSGQGLSPGKPVNLGFELHEDAKNLLPADRVELGVEGFLRMRDKAEYYQIGYALNRSPRFSIVNCDTVQKSRKGLEGEWGWPHGRYVLSGAPWLFPKYDETPIIKIERRKGKPSDLEIVGSFWIISKALKTVLELLDPGACEFRPCETIGPKGEPPVELWLCTVVRAFVGVVDVAHSKNVHILRYNGLPNFVPLLGYRLALDKTTIGDVPLFRIAEFGLNVFCSHAARTIFEAAKITGMRFDAVSPP